MSNQAHVGIALAKQSINILKKRKVLILLPLLNNLIGTTLFCAVFFWLFDIEKMVFDNEINLLTKKMIITFYVAFFALFFVLHLLNILSNAGVSACIINHLQNKPYHSVKTAFSTIGKRFTTLYFWTSFMTTFGIFVVITQYWSDHWHKTNIAKNWLCGLPWATAVFFVTPILSVEKIKVVSAVKESAALVQQNWGNNITPHYRIGKISIPLRILTFIPVLAGIIIGKKIALIIGSIITTILFLCLNIVLSSMDVVLTAALYLHAKQINISDYFDTELLKCAFQSKTQEPFFK